MALGPGPRGNRCRISASPWPVGRFYSFIARFSRALAESATILVRGSVMTETVVVIPVLLASIVGLLSLGLRLSDHMYLAQAARDIGLVLSRIPHMYEIGNYEFQANPLGPAGPIRSAVESCISQRFNSNYQGCTTPDCRCVKTVAEWYTNQHLRGKKLAVAWPVDVSLSYQKRDASDTTSGICFIRVKLQAFGNDGLPSFGALGGSFSAEAFVPYVGDPVYFQGGACKP